MCRIFQRGDRRILFIHIPKTGGTSVIDLLVRNGWLTTQKIPEISPGLKAEFPSLINSKHQHNILRQSWSAEWEYEFSLVRNPYSRAFSQAKHCAKRTAHVLGKNPRYPKSYGFGLWMHKIITDTIEKQGMCVDDNHFRPQSEFISKDTDWFRIEDQKDRFLESLKLRDIISKTSDLDCLNFSFPEDERDPSTTWMRVKNVHEKFIDIYGEDFKNFGYQI